MRLLHVLEKNRLTTGSVVQMAEAAAGLARVGNRVVVASRPGGDLEHASAAAGVSFAPLRLTSAFDLASAAALRRILRDEGIELVHAHKGRAHSIVLLAAAGLGPAPAVVVNRGVVFPLDRFNRWKYRHPRVSAVVCVAEAVRKVVMTSARVAAERVVTIYGGTDTARFDPQAVDRQTVRHQLGVGAETLLVGQVSVRDWKGWRELIAAFAEVERCHRGARLLLVGCESGVERQKVEAAAAAQGLVSPLLTLPFRRDMEHVLAACDVVVDASWAGTGITGTIREAMALERAVVATDCGGNRELVIDGEVGLVVTPRDVEGLGSAIGRLLADPGLRQRLGSEGRQRVVTGFSTTVRVERLQALYRRLVEMGSGTAPKRR